MQRRPPCALRDRRHDGFTLIEVMVALVVVAIGLAALMVAVSSTARTSGRLRDKALAQWIALNRLAEVRLNITKFGANTDKGELKFANRQWHYDTRYFDTSIATMKRIVVRVYAGDSKAKGGPVVESVGFLGTAIAQAGSTTTDWTSGTTTSATATGTGTGTTPTAPGQTAPTTPGVATPNPTTPHHADAHPEQPVKHAAVRRRGSQAAFTLIELLVALLILSVMSALGYGTYRAGRMSAERTEVSLQRTREIEFGMRVMAQDFAELAPRPIRDPLGQSRLPALRGTYGAGKITVTPQSLGANSTTGSSSISTSTSSFSSGPSSISTSSSSFGSTQVAPSIVDLTRTSWSNTAGQQRGSLQRVSYSLIGDVLKRSYQVNLDTVLANKPVVQDLFTGVGGIQFRYLDGNQAWQNAWPSTAASADPDQSRPIAVEIIIEFKDWGPVRRLVEISG